MGLVVLDGFVVLVLVLARRSRGGDARDPPRPRLAIGAGIGLFIAFIGAVNARLVVVPPRPSPLGTIRPRPFRR